MPAKRVLLGLYVEDYLAVGGDKAFDRLVGLSLGWLVKSRPAVWEQYAAARPTLRDLVDVGSVQFQSFSLERALATPFIKDWGQINPKQLLVAKPQVVLIAGYESVSQPDAMQMGFGVPAGEARRRLQGFAQPQGTFVLS